MADRNDVFDFQREMIERDLTPFTDPGTRLELQREARALSARWSSRGKAMEARFVLSPDGGVQVCTRNQTLTYRSFLAGPEMADLLGLAKMILQTHSPGIFVQTKARLSEDADPGPRPAVSPVKPFENVTQGPIVETSENVTFDEIFERRGVGLARSGVIAFDLRQSADGNLWAASCACASKSRPQV